MEFLRCYDINEKVCDRLIDYFHRPDTRKVPGHMVYQGKPRFNTELKSSTDHWIEANSDIDPCIDEYFDELTVCTDLYIDEFPYCAEYGEWSVCEGANIQWYKPNEGYFQWHTERVDGEYPTASRHLVWMTYLNTVDDAGETEFYHQNLKIKPKKGKTVIWPADWTYTHRGITSPTQDKYIITGWYNFTSPL